MDTATSNWIWTTTNKMDNIRQEKLVELTRMHSENIKWLDGYLEDITSRTNREHIADLLKTPGRRKSPIKRGIQKDVQDSPIKQPLFKKSPTKGLTIAEIETLSPLRNPFESSHSPSPSPSPAFTTPKEQSPIESPVAPESTTPMDLSPAPSQDQLLAASTTSMDMFVPLKDDSDKQQEEARKSFKHALASTPSSVFATSPAPNRKSTLNFASLPPREPITAKKSSITKKSSVGSSLMWNLAAQAQAAKQALEQEVKEREAEETKEREVHLKEREEQLRQREAAELERKLRELTEQHQRDKEAAEIAAAEKAMRDQEIERKRIELSQKRQQERPPTGHAESTLAKKRKVFTDASKDMRIKMAPKVIKIKVPAPAPNKPPVVETKQPTLVKKPALPNKPDIKNVKAKVDTGLRPAQNQLAKSVKTMQTTAIKTSNAPIQFVGKQAMAPTLPAPVTTSIIAKTSIAHLSSAKSSAASTTTVATTSTKATTLSGPAPPIVPAVPSESIELPEIDSEYSSDDDQSQKKKKKKDLLPQWAQSPELRWALAQQQGLNPDHIFGNIKPIQMEEIFKRADKKFRARTSSANWTGTDRLTLQEEQDYYKVMGFDN